MITTLTLALATAPFRAAQAPPGPADLPPAPAKPAEEPARWLDPEDGWLDLSTYLASASGFLPIVVPITEPALGYGAVVAALFLDPREEAGSEGWARPDITVVGGLWTEDGSAGLFALNSSLWNDGDLQTIVGGGAIGLELGLYGLGDSSTLPDAPLDYALDVDGAIAEVRQRIADSPFWGGLRFAYADIDVNFEDDVPAVLDEEMRLSGPSVSLRYDSLDNVFTPTTGTLSETSVSVFDEFFGGSRDFQSAKQVWIQHWALASDLFLGVRGEFDASFGDVPFYARPYIDLRGVPAQRYQGDRALSAELELRWQCWSRIGLVGFGGAGIAWSDADEGELDYRREQDAWSGGVGARYLISRKFGLHVGIDVARGPEDGAVYVQFGNAWMRP